MQTSSVHKRHVPKPLTSLVGREQEIKDVCSLLSRCRLVTLTGSGGVGKTRLSIAVAESLKDKFLDGIWFVDLALVNDEATVPSAIARSLEIQEDSGKPLLDTIENRLLGRDLLLILDNCEHLPSSVAAILERLLSASEGLHVLATSRQPVGVSGESVWRVPSLGLPDETAPESLLSSDAVQLFLQRAGIDDKYCAAQTSAIALICRRLDGLPLAIELAAARTNVLTPREIESRLDDRFALLTVGGKSLARHQTLQASMEWSWDLLTEAERDILMCASVFRGGCTLEAIDALFGAPALDHLSSLFDRSMVNVRQTKSGSRFYLLETIRQFAWRQVELSGRADTLRDRHKEFFFDLLEEGFPSMSTPAETPWLELYETEHENIRAAIAWCHQSGDHVSALQALVWMSRFWGSSGYLSEGRAQYAQALSYEMPNISKELRATAHLYAGWMATAQHDSASAVSHYGECLPFYEELGDENALAKIYTCMGIAELHALKYEEATALFERAIHHYGNLNSVVGVAANYNNLAEVALARNDNSTARQLLVRSQVHRDEVLRINPETMGQILCAMATVECRDNKLDVARETVLDSIRIFNDWSLFVNIPGAFQQLAIIESKSHQWDRAAILLGACSALSPSRGALISYLANDQNEALARAQSRMKPGQFEAAFQVGRNASLEQVIQLALGMSFSATGEIPAALLI